MKWQLGLLWCLISWQFALAQNVQFEARADANRVAVGQTFSVFFTLKNADPSNFQAPDFKGFRLISGPSQSYRTSIINGRTSKEVSFSYTLQPTKVGTYTIGPASVTVNNRRHRSNQLKVQVTKQVNPLEAGEGEVKFFVRARVDTNRAYIGQQVQIEYKIYTLVNIENYNVLSESNYDGCYSVVLDAHKEPVRKENINGIEYSTKVLRKVSVFPQQSGKIDIEPLVVRVGVPSGGRRSFFSSFNLKTHNLSSNALSLIVESPYDDAPHDFSGAVGSFQTQYTIHPTQATTDDAIAVELRIVGNGDIKTVKVPTLELPGGFDSYDPKVKDEKMINATDSVRGEKIIEYLIMGQQPGKYVLRPSFTYFDNETRQYKRLVDSFDISITQGAGLSSTQADNQLLTTQNRALRPIMFDTALRQVRRPMYLRPGYWAAFSVPLLSFVFFVWRAKREEQQALQTEVDHQAEAKARLQQAHAHLEAGEAGPFFEEVALSVKNYIAHVYDIPAEDLSKAHIQRTLAQGGLAETEIQRVSDLLDRCDLALYGGLTDPAKMQDTYAQALEVLSMELGGGSGE